MKLSAFLEYAWIRQGHTWLATASTRVSGTRESDMVVRNDGRVKRRVWGKKGRILPYLIGSPAGNLFVCYEENSFLF